MNSPLSTRNARVIVPATSEFCRILITAGWRRTIGGTPIAVHPPRLRLAMALMRPSLPAFALRDVTGE